MNKKEYDIMRTRWRRWLGQKTRIDKPYWTTLLDNNWRGWASNVLQQNAIEANHAMIISREEIKVIFSKAIDSATIEDLYKLDNLYCEDKLNL